MSAFTLGSLVPRVTDNDMNHQPGALILLDLWNYFNLISNNILLPILVATFVFSKRAKRHPTLINLCMTWILSGVYSLLLFYAGVPHPTNNEPGEPSRALCVAQTTLIYGIPPMWSVATLVLMYYLVAVAKGNTGSELGKGKMILMLGSPYIVEFAFSLTTLIISLTQDPKKVKRSHGFFFCALRFNPLYDAMAIFTFIMYLGISALEVQLAIYLYRNWRGLRQAGRRVNVEVQLLLRVLAFGIYIFFGMVVNVLSMFNSHNYVPEVYFATVGTVIFLVFGTQADVIRVWCFWRKDSPPPPPKPADLIREYRLRPTMDLRQSSESTLGLQSPSASITLPSEVHDNSKVRGHRHMNAYEHV